jgi:hypothetical protein
MLLFTLLLMLMLGLVVAIAALAGAGRLVGSAARGSAGDRQARRARRLAAVLAASSVVGLVVWMSGFFRDQVIVVDGERTRCSVPIGEDLPRRVAEQCDAQSYDRSMQARAAGLTAAVASAIVLWAATGRRRHGRGETLGEQDLEPEIPGLLKPEV